MEKENTVKLQPSVVNWLLHKNDPFKSYNIGEAYKLSSNSEIGSEFVYEFVNKFKNFNFKVEQVLKDEFHRFTRYVVTLESTSKDTLYIVHGNFDELFDNETIILTRAESLKDKYDEFMSLESDVERWKWVIENQDTGIEILLDNDDTFGIINGFMVNDDDQYVFAFDHYIGNGSGVFDLLKAIGVKCEGA